MFFSSSLHSSLSSLKGQLKLRGGYEKSRKRKKEGREVYDMKREMKKIGVYKEGPRWGRGTGILVHAACFGKANAFFGR